MPRDSFIEKNNRTLSPCPSTKNEKSWILNQNGKEVVYLGYPHRTAPTAPLKTPLWSCAAKSPLEKIKIKDLCALACINKSTFYAHHEDIYALSRWAGEDKLIDSILACVTAADGKLPP